MIPPMLSRPLRAFVREAVGLRLKGLPLSMDQAEWWGRRMQQIPAWFGPDGPTRERALPGRLRLTVGLIDHIERHLWLEGEWDRPVGDVLKAWLEPGGTFVDLGANIGYFTTMGSRLVGEAGTVVAFEPSHRALRKLTQATFMNRCRNVIVVSAAAGRDMQTADLVMATPGNIGGSTILPGAHARPTERAFTLPVGEALGRLGIEPTLIKIDIEGLELSALRGIFPALSARPPVVCEVTPLFLERHQQSAAELFQFVRGLGYQVYRLQSADDGHTFCRSIETADHGTEQCDALFCVGAPRLPVAEPGVRSSIGADPRTT